MPYWGDDSHDWKGLYEAERLINNIVSFGRVGLNSKEKYGSIRYNFSLFDGTIHSITHPGHYYLRFPKYMYDIVMGRRLLLPLLPIIRPIQVALVKLAFTIAARRYPHLTKYIITDAPTELLPLDLALLNRSYWKQSCNSCNELTRCDNIVCEHCGADQE